MLNEFDRLEVFTVDVVPDIRTFTRLRIPAPTVVVSLRSMAIGACRLLWLITLSFIFMGTWSGFDAFVTEERLIYFLCGDGIPSTFKFEFCLD